MLVIVCILLRFSWKGGINRGSGFFIRGKNKCISELFVYNFLDKIGLE